MKKVNTTYWKQFRVGDLFDIHPTKAYKLTNKELLDGGTTPVVVNSSYNNGIGGFSTKQATEKGGMITFSDTVDAYTIFYQENDFVGYPHVQGLYPIGEYASFWSEYSLKFFATIFRKKAINNSFDYSYKFRRDIAVNLNVLLPAKDDSPDWLYMEEYIRRIEQRTKTAISAFVASKNKPHKVDTAYWKEFALNSLFKPFYAVSHGRVNILLPRFSINHHIAKFVISVLDASFQMRYSFSGMCSQSQLMKEKILLPATPAGEPDWRYMEMYMRGVEAIAKEKISLLTSKKQEPVQGSTINNYGTVNIYEK